MAMAAAMKLPEYLNTTLLIPALTADQRLYPTLQPRNKQAIVGPKAKVNLSYVTSYLTNLTN